MAGCGSNGSETTKQSEAQTESAMQQTAGESGETEADNKLIMVTEAGFAPYEYTEDGETVIGVDVDIANEIAKELGMELEIQNTNIRWCINGCSAGQG